jgi:arylsulfatase A-like enzyme
MRNTNRLFVLLCMVCVLGGCADSPEEEAVVEVAPAVVPPNIILISIDTARADHFSVYGYERPTTPFLEKFAGEGVVFERAYAPMGITGPSYATLFTGLHPITHGVIKNGLALAEGHETLAEILSGEGYQTFGVVSSFVLDGKFGFAQGFDVYDDEIGIDEGDVKVDEWEGFELEKGFDRRAEHTTAIVLDWLSGGRDSEVPFFMFVHFFDPHAPYIALDTLVDEVDPDWRTRDYLGQGISIYDTEIRVVDTAIGKIVERLEALGLDENTVVIVTADHGEGLMEHGYLMHGLGVYEEEVHVPLLMRWSGQLPAGRRIAEPVMLNDVLPTVLSFAGTSAAAGDVPGINLHAVISGRESISSDRLVFMHRRHYADMYANAALPGMYSAENEPEAIHLLGQQYAVRKGRWKYTISPELGVQELYDLERDPGELDDVSAEEPGISESLKGDLERWVGEQRRPVEPGAVLLDGDREALKALGYIE